MSNKISVQNALCPYVWLKSTKITFKFSLDQEFHKKNLILIYSLRKYHVQKLSPWTGFEPVREYPIGFRVQRLNHSAITTWLHGTFVLTHQINDVKEVCSKKGKNCVVLFEHILRRIICILNRESRWRRENIHKNIFCGLTPPTKKRN